MARHVFARSHPADFSTSRSLDLSLLRRSSSASRSAKVQADAGLKIETTFSDRASATIYATKRPANPRHAVLKFKSGRATRAHAHALHGRHAETHTAGRGSGRGIGASSSFALRRGGKRPKVHGRAGGTEEGARSRVHARAPL